MEKQRFNYILIEEDMGSLGVTCYSSLKKLKNAFSFAIEEKKEYTNFAYFIGDWELMKNGEISIIASFEEGKIKAQKLILK